MNNKFKVEGIWTFKLKDLSSGKIIKEETKKNLIVNNGLNLIRNWMAGDSVNPPSNLAIGEGTTPVAVGNTAMESLAINSAATITKPADYQVRYEHEFFASSGFSYNITEAGLFDNSTTMFSHILTGTTYPVTVSTSLLVIATITISRV